MSQTCNIYIIGVGGQGIGAAGRVITHAARAADVNVAGVETHGLAQRGGVVVSTVRLGDEPGYSPLIAPGEADVLFALEAVEAWRAARYLRKGGTLIVNLSPIDPLMTRLEREPYPPLDEIPRAFEGFAGGIVALDATGYAVERGSWISTNAVLLGALAGSGALPFDGAMIEEGIRQTSKPAYLEVNLDCYRRGYAAAVEVAETS
jgi:indolepyruvate ferredoxin oxidoreductase beta subunit